MVKTKNYQNGQIYKIVDTSFQLCYIGSTIDKLSNRFNSHKSTYNKYRLGISQKYTSAFVMFDIYGVENCKIIWIEDCPCNSKKELEAREGQLQKETECVNKRVEGRTPEQWRQDNKEKLAEQHQQWAKNNQEHLKGYKAQHYQKNKEYYNQKGKEWRENNKDKKRAQDKQYREEHQEELKLYFQNYNQTHKEKRKRYQQQLYNCKCGTVVCFSSKSHHFKSKKHQDWLKQQEPEKEPDLQQLD